MHVKAIKILIGIAVLGTALSFIAPRKTNLTIRFKSFVGDIRLTLDSVTYKNALGQAYTVSKFKYYIGNISLQSKSGQYYTSTQYFLVNEEDVPSTEITLSDIPEGDYNSISFILGVDSIHNCSGAQSGALDPINGMFWTWNTGYIFLKIEGKSPVSKSPGNLLEFHIGGYRQPANCIRTIALGINNGISIKPGAGSTLTIKTDAAQLFKAHASIDFSNTSSVTDFHGATILADNYKDMFSIIYE
jgi:hypothetical protein